MASKKATLGYWQSTDGDWRFHLAGGNNEVQVSGEGYRSEAGVLQGIIDAKTNIAIAAVKRIPAPKARKARA